VIPARVVEVLHGPSVMQVGTRNVELRPAHSYVWGAVVHDDRQTITFFVTERRSVRILGDLENNRQVALTIAQASHEAYQLKGAYLSSHPSTEEMVKPMFLGAEYRPSVAITFRVEAVFEQTPGPRAGSQLV
jgi:hypothetical protein